MIADDNAAAASTKFPIKKPVLKKKEALAKPGSTGAAATSLTANNDAKTSRATVTVPVPKIAAGKLATSKLSKTAATVEPKEITSPAAPPPLKQSFVKSKAPAATSLMRLNQEDDSQSPVASASEGSTNSSSSGSTESFEESDSAAGHPAEPSPFVKGAFKQPEPESLSISPRSCHLAPSPLTNLTLQPTKLVLKQAAHAHPMISAAAPETSASMDEAAGLRDEDDYGHPLWPQQSKQPHNFCMQEQSVSGVVPIVTGESGSTVESATGGSLLSTLPPIPREALHRPWWAVSVRRQQQEQQKRRVASGFHCCGF